ncbi:MAG: response regulator [Bacteroidota bacterium]
MNPKPKICIVDDHKLFAESLQFLIENLGIGTITGIAINGLQFLNLLEKEGPFDLVLMDISMPSMDGIEATEKALKMFPDLKIVIISMHSEQKYYQEIIIAGVKGFVLKSSGKDVFKKAITDVLAGESYFSPEFLRRVIVKMEKGNKTREITQQLGISQREIEVLKLLSKGYTAKEIAEKLYVSENTIHAHRNNLLKKTSSRNSISLVLFAIKNNLVAI